MGNAIDVTKFVKWQTTGGWTVDQKVKVVLFYAETKSVVATQRRFRARFGTRWAPCKQTIYGLSLGTIFQPMRINSVPDVKRFCKSKNVLCVQSMVWHFVRHPLHTHTHNRTTIQRQCSLTAICGGKSGVGLHRSTVEKETSVNRLHWALNEVHTISGDAI